MNSTRNIRLLSIVETGFSLVSDKIPATKELCEQLIKPGFGFNLSPDLENSKLTANATVFYGFPGKANEIVASLSFSYTIHIERMNEIISDAKGEARLTAPIEIMTTIVNDVYATARALVSIRLSSTPLRDLYLPFDGARHILNELGK